MNIPLQMTFRGIEASELMESTIRERAERLERFCSKIGRCHVTVDVPHRHHQKGNHYNIRIELVTPAGAVVITRDPTRASAHASFQVAVRDAFDAAARHLDGVMRRTG
jgi:ribosome-associated translation inhibitor RaiA